MEPQTLAEAGPSRASSTENVVERKDRESSPKRRRKTRACDRCHKSGVKCSAGPVEGACGPCSTFGTRCTYDRPVKRRGPPPKHADPETQILQSTPIYIPMIAPPSDGWVHREVAPQAVIEELVAFYAAAIYPLQPYYHLPTLLHRLRNQEYTRSRPFFVDLMSLCALTSARIRDGASAPTHPITSGMTSVPSEAFNQAALDAFPTDLEAAPEFEYKRAKSNLALLCIQFGDTRGLQRHLGDYCTLGAMEGFHLESRWPAGLSMVELQERRRLFWATYQLDIYTSCTWGATARHRESETTVLYPAEVMSDDDVTPSAIRLPNSEDSTNSEETVSWYRGWNFVCDLYRILEHAIERVRIRRNGSSLGASIQSEEALIATGQGGPVSALFERGVGPAQSEILDLVGKMYHDLPEALRVAAPLGEDEDGNRLGFQATNIIITLQTVKMVVAGSSENSIAQRCAIAGDLLDAISNVPTAYIYACSAPVLHHLAGIGHLLIPLSQHPQSRSLNQWTYLQVRNCLLSMADMLSGLESVLSRTAGIAERLRTHIERIDRAMEDAAREREGRGVVHALRRVESTTLGRSGSKLDSRTRSARGGAERQGESATRSTTTNLPAASSSAVINTRQDTSNGSNIRGTSGSDGDGGFDLSSIDFDAYALAEPQHVIDPILLATLTTADYPYNSENATSGGHASGTGTSMSASGVSGDQSGNAGVFPADEDLFADWPMILGNAFEFLGSE